MGARGESPPRAAIFANQRSNKFKLVIDPGTARALGVIVPQVLAAARRQR
jgi:hypothetical protein